MSRLAVVVLGASLVVLTGLGPCAPRFVDNGDGTVSDRLTGLQWEQKVSGASCLHCVLDTYTWNEAMQDWISEVNGTSPDGTLQIGLGGHSDWRVPTILELRTLLVTPHPCAAHPCIPAIFGPTASDDYWSATTKSITPGFVWVVEFFDGFLEFEEKDDPFQHVRAVRGVLP